MKKIKYNTNSINRYKEIIKKKKKLTEMSYCL